MSRGQLTTVIHYLHRVAGSSAGGVADGQLVERWVESRDEAAFEVLVWRHGTMVANVCRRVLRCEHDVEDAFQATFLTLARKAGAIGQRESVGSWLYKVAYRVACAARLGAAKRVQRERSSVERRQTTVTATPADDILPVLDEEVNRLPHKYRVPFVLCYLQGKSTDEAAQELSWPRGTVATRLAWARQRLRTRLNRRGLTASATALTFALASNVSLAASPEAWVASTVKAALQFAAGSSAAAGAGSAQAAALSQGVIYAMMMTKVRIAAGVLLMVGALAAGIGMLAHTALAERPAADFSPAATPVEITQEAQQANPAKNRDGAQPNPAAQKDREDLSIRGILNAVDPDKKTITVHIQRDGGKIEDHTLSFGKDVVISVAGKEKAGVADLKVKMRVTVVMSADRKNAVRISEAVRGGRARQNVVTGTFRKLDKDSIVVAIPGQREGETTDRSYKVVDKAPVSIPGIEQARLADLKAGTRIVLQLSPDQTVVIAVRTLQGER
jgi:RNA polymerase sigma factor (sigma-70 family)